MMEEVDTNDVKTVTANIQKKFDSLREFSRVNSNENSQADSADIKSLLLNIFDYIRNQDQKIVAPCDAAPREDDKNFLLPDESPNAISEEGLNKQHETNKDDIQIEDPTYGLRRTRRGSLLLGETPVEIKDKKMYIENETFEFTPGLRQLLTLKYPKDYTEQDLSCYKSLLLLTAAHRCHNQQHSRVKANGDYKYREIIAKLFPPTKKWLKRKEKNAIVTSTNQSFSSTQSDAGEDGNSLNNITPVKQSLSPKVDPLRKRKLINNTTPISVKKIRDSSLRLEPVTSDAETPEIDEGTLKTAMSDIQAENYRKQKLREMYSYDSLLDTSYKERNRRIIRVCYDDVLNIETSIR